MSSNVLLIRDQLTAQLGNLTVWCRHGCRQTPDWLPHIRRWCLYIRSLVPVRYCSFLKYGTTVKSRSTRALLNNLPFNPVGVFAHQQFDRRIHPCVQDFKVAATTTLRQLRPGTCNWAPLFSPISRAQLFAILSSHWPTDMRLPRTGPSTVGAATSDYMTRPRNFSS